MKSPSPSPIRRLGPKPQDSFTVPSPGLHAGPITMVGTSGPPLLAATRMAGTTTGGGHESRVYAGPGVRHVGGVHPLARHDQICGTDVFLLRPGMSSGIPCGSRPV